MARSVEFFECVGPKLTSHKPAIRLNLLRIMGSICDATDEGGFLLEHFGLLDIIRDLQMSDSAVLVRSMAQELIRSCEEIDNVSMHSGSGGAAGGKRRINGANPLRRTSASTTPPHLLERQMSMPVGPSSPQLGRAERNGLGFFDGTEGASLSGRLAQTPRRQRNGIGYIGSSGAIRPASRDSTSGIGRESSPAFNFPTPGLQRASTSIGALSVSSGEGSGTSEPGFAKSRLPRAGSQQRAGRQNTPPVNPSRESAAGTPSSSTSRAAAARVARESLYGARNGGVDVTVASARRTAARRNLNGEGKWS